MAEDVGGGDVLSGFGVVTTDRGASTGDLYGASDAGMTAHRGVLHPDEYVDTLALREAVLAEFGVSYPEFTGAYKNGRPTAEERQLRAEIDAQLLALSRAGTNLVQLAGALGVSDKTLYRAVQRAEDVEVVPVVRHPAVVKPRVCFKCEAPTAKPRKRSSRDTPAHLRGTVNLCDGCYAQGFEARKGNPAYWAFRSRIAIPAGAYA